MITHSIIVANEHLRRKVQNKSTKFQGVWGSAEHREFILSRAVINNPYKVDDWVVYRRKKKVVLDVYTHSEEGVKWQGLKPLFIELWGDNELTLVHPGDIKKARK